MIWQISHMIFEIQVTLSEDPVKITRDRSGSDCVQSEFWLGLSALTKSHTLLIHSSRWWEPATELRSGQL